MSPNEIDFIKQKLRESGFTLEYEVSSQVLNSGWSLQSNTSFLDRDLGKGREIDIKAENGAYTSGPDIVLRLLIECKKISGNAWIFYSQIPTTGFLGRMSFRRVTAINIFDILGLSSSLNDVIHASDTHFSSTNIPKFTSFKEVIVNEDKSNKRTDNVWTATTKLIKATCQELETFCNEMKKDWHTVQKRIREGEQGIGAWSSVVGIVYPAIVFDGKIYGASLAEDIELLQHEYVQLFVDYRSENYKGSFIVDVMTKNYFPIYLKQAEEDINLFGERADKLSESFKKEIVNAAKSRYSDWKLFRPCHPRDL